mmetsp:Transcript_96909/g.273926  ORF Transcript_96909/g.273926 Transcript_96909/m.273926 type:complete len:444 (-) Transcript_96909:184-1515(-)
MERAAGYANASASSAAAPVATAARAEAATSAATKAAVPIGAAPAAASTRLAPSLPAHLKLVRSAGKGAYGEVYLCEDARTQSKVAVKWIRNFTKDPLCGKRILREIRLLATMRHDNLLRLIDLLPVPSPDFDDVYLVMPFMDIDLQKAIYSKMKLSESHCQAFVCQILRGLKYLHSAGIAHRDLKPANVLVNADCTLRIADFGLARGRVSEDEALTDYVVTRWYRAPELMMLPSGYFEAVDLWSAGCIQAEIKARKPLFNGQDHCDMLRRIARTLGFDVEADLAWLPADGREKVRGMLEVLKLPAQPCEGEALTEFLPAVSDSFLDLLRRLLEKNPMRRISASDALAHPYVAHLHDPVGEATAPSPFAWDFDSGWEPTKRALQDRVYGECVRYHPEIVRRDAEWLSSRGFLPQQGGGPAPGAPPPGRAPRKQQTGPSQAVSTS